MKKSEIGALFTVVGMIVSAIVYIVTLKADLTHHLNEHPKFENQISELRQRLTTMEKRRKDVLVTSSVAPVPDSSVTPCLKAKIVGLPERITAMDRTTPVDWIPAHCKMIIQSYKNGSLINEFEKIPIQSGKVTLGEVVTDKDKKIRLGMIELKIVVPGETEAAHRVWVEVQ